MSINLIVGLPRSGKSTFACILASEYLKRGRRKVGANFPIHDPRVEMVTRFEELKMRPNFVYFLDEAAGWFGSRDWQKTKDGDLSYFRQHGHDDVTLWLIAHSLADLETKIVNVLAVNIWVVTRISGGPNEDERPTAFEEKFGIWSICKRWNVKEYLSQSDKKRKLPSKMRFINVTKQHSRFDSGYVVGDRDGVGARAGNLHAAIHAAQTLHPLGCEDVYHRSRFQAEDGSNFFYIRTDVAVLNGNRVLDDKEVDTYVGRS